MKIIEVIPHLKSGGAEKFVVDISGAFDRLGHESYVLTLFTPMENDLLYQQLPLRVKKDNLNKKPGFDLRLFFKLFRHIEATSPDIVHFHIGAIKYGLISALFYRKCKYYATIHSEAKREAGKGIEKWVRKFMFRHHLMIPVTISPESESSFYRFYGYHTLMIPNGCAPYSPKNLDTLFNEYHLDVDFLFVHAGRVHPVKNQKMLVTAIERVQELGYKVRLLILGRGDNDEITKFITDHTSKFITYLGERANVRDYVAISDAFCLSSIQEGLPITALESFSVGTPVISTPVGGCLNVIKDGETGKLAREVSVDAYVDTLIEFMTSKQKDRARMRETCQKEFKDNYTIEKCAERYLKAFNR